MNRATHDPVADDPGSWKAAHREDLAQRPDHWIAVDLGTGGLTFAFARAEQARFRKEVEAWFRAHPGGELWTFFHGELGTPE